MFYTNLKVISSYIILTLVIHVAISACWLKYCGLTYSTSAVIQFVLVQGISFYISLNIVDIIFALLLPFKALHKIGELENEPKVALLYTVCDDHIIEALASLTNQDYSNYQIFILDDSELFEKKKEIDELALQYGCTLIRRPSRQGYKAGNLNNWLKVYSTDFKYFIIADSDSVLPGTFINEALKFAESNANKEVAVFQSKVLFWNTHIYYSRIMNIAQPVSNFILERLSQRDLTYSNFGSNAIYRTKEINECGGFSENYVAEDFALQLSLAKSGYYCRVINVESYSAHPETLSKARRRIQRWASQTIQLLNFPSKGIPLQLILATIKSTFFYCVWPFYLLGLVSLLFSSIFIYQFYTISFKEGIIYGFYAFFHPIGILLIGLFLFQLFIRGFISFKLKIKISSYLMNCIYSMAEGFFLIIPITWCILKYPISRKVIFNPTNKMPIKKVANEGVIWGFLFCMIWLTVIISIFLAPNIFLLNSFWLVPAVLSPFLLWKLKTKRV